MHFTDFLYTLYYTKMYNGVLACTRSELAILIFNVFAAAHNNILFKAAFLQCINNHQVVEASIAANILYLSA